MNSTLLTRAAFMKAVQPLLISVRMRWFWSGIVIGALLALGFFIRQPAERGLSYVEGFYTPNVQYGAWYLASHHTLFATTGELPVLSNYTSGLTYGAVDYTYTFLTGSALILSGVTDVEQIGQLYLLSPWQGLLLIPLAVPLLVFGAGALSTGGASGIALCAAISLLLVAIAPFAAGAAIRAARVG